MGRTIAALALGMFFVATSGASADPSADGVWMRGDGNARVQIAPCGDKLCATNVWIKDTSKGEDVGDKLVMDVQPSGTNTLKGTAYDAKRKATYTLSIKIAEARLVTRGCVAAGILCKSVNWSRVSD